MRSLATMPDAPAISVVMSTHHRPHLLRRALQSLQAQSFQDFEVIVCADESSAQTQDAARAGLRPLDSLILLPGHRGPAATRNLGTRVAQGRWICYLDDDDSLEEDYFHRAMEALGHQPGIVHYFNYTWILERREGEAQTELQREIRDTGTQGAQSLEVRNFIPINALFIPAEVAKAHDFDANLGSHEDWDHLIRLARACEFRHHGQTGPNVHVCEGASRNNDALRSGGFVLDYLSIYRKWPSRTDAIRSARRQMLAGHGLDLPEVFL